MLGFTVHLSVYLEQCVHSIYHWCACETWVCALLSAENMQVGKVAGNI